MGVVKAHVRLIVKRLTDSLVSQTCWWKLFYKALNKNFSLFCISNFRLTELEQTLVCTHTHSLCRRSDFCRTARAAAAPRRWRRRPERWPWRASCSERSASSDKAARTRPWSGSRSEAPRCGLAARSSACPWWAQMGRPGTPACRRADGGTELRSPG